MKKAYTMIGVFAALLMARTTFAIVCMVPSCDDNNACTTDACGAVGCTHTPISCNDNNMCTIDTCNPSIGCVHTAIACDDNNACTTDTCNPSSGCNGTPIICDDHDSCTVDSCNPETGCFTTPGCLNLGDSCGSDAQCSSTFCVSGLCCNSACSGDLNSCSIPGKLGQCTAVSQAPAASPGWLVSLAMALLGGAAFTFRRARQH